MGDFFIRRPIVAIVIAILTVIVGGVTLLRLPISEYPNVSPPTIQVSATYRGADAEAVEQSVATPIESQINGVQNMLYLKSLNGSDGSMSLQTTFEVGTDVDIAQVNTQNRTALAQSQLPGSVQQQGLKVERSSPDILMVIGLSSPSNTYDGVFLGNYANINLVDAIARVNGVGSVKNFTAPDYSMRLWVRPDKLAALGLTAADVLNAVRDQNVQSAAGQIGSEPAKPGTEFQFNVRASGLLREPSEFGEIIVRSNPDGGEVKVKDVARVELGAQTYNLFARVNRSQGAVLGVYLAPGGNAIATADAIQKLLVESAQRFPPDVAYKVILDSTRPIKASMEEIVHTLFEAIVLVILVVFIFLQSARATFIPLLTVPVSLIGTFAIFPLLGFSVNTLTLFGLVLAIGIVVDDAIVVVEAVQHHLEHGLDPKEATRKAMQEVSGPVIAIALVLCAVFVPVAFMGGLTGALYKQFAITIAVSVIFSAINALTLSPALCAMLLRKPGEKRGPLGWFFTQFNKYFDRATGTYAGIVGFLVRRVVRSMFILVAVVVAVLLLAKVVPGGFIPNEDKGYLFVAAELPDAASLQRTDELASKVEAVLGTTDGISDFATIGGLNILTGAVTPNACTWFVGLKDWKERSTPQLRGRGLGMGLTKKLFLIPEARILVFGPPALPGFGNAAGFTFELQDRSGGSVERLADQLQKFIAEASKRPELTRLYSGFRPTMPQVKVDLDRQKAQMLGVRVSDVFNTLQAYLGGAYINDFVRFGRVFRVFLQAEPEFTNKPDDIGRFFVRSTSGKMIPLDTLVKVSKTQGPAATTRYNLYRTAEITGTPAAGYTSAQAIAAMEEVARETLPSDMSYEWSGLTLQEKKAEGQAGVIFGLAILFVFLLLAAQYESWSLPFAVLLATPLVALGTFLGLLLRSFDLNVYGQIGLIMLVGLAAKNAILIVEFAQMRRVEGDSLIDAAIAGARLRLRPILMTSFAFILGCVPLAIASGSGAAARQVMGTAVVFGMTVTTVGGIFLVPVCFVFTQRWVKVPPKAAPETPQALTPVTGGAH
jgi:hydrophobic/amphiphilic exporter-1 (mainly G- bacteria), HAE1 family